MLTRAISEEKRGLFGSKLLRWFAANRRFYPWRRTRNPYRVLMAEFMLQRTGATQTVPVYRAFARRFPTLSRAAAASERQLASVLAPLGRIGRARQLRMALNTLTGRFRRRVPEREDLLLQLSGVGRYTARAVLVFAYGKRLGLFDPNISRVISRVFDVRSRRSRPHMDIKMWKTAASLVPRRRVREFNWAMLDLGASVCRSKDPRCNVCPMTGLCRYYQRLKQAA
jgi:A/G-specific adenine glycosylase